MSYTDRFSLGIAWTPKQGMTLPSGPSRSDVTPAAHHINKLSEQPRIEDAPVLVMGIRIYSVTAPLVAAIRDIDIAAEELFLKIMPPGRE